MFNVTFSVIFKHRDQYGAGHLEKNLNEWIFSHFNGDAKSKESFRYFIYRKSSKTAFFFLGHRHYGIFKKKEVTKNVLRTIAPDVHLCSTKITTAL